MSKQKSGVLESSIENHQAFIKKSSLGELFTHLLLKEKANNIEREISAKKREIIKLQDNLKEVEALISNDEGAPPKMEAIRPMLHLLNERAIEMKANGEARFLKVAWNKILDGFNFPENERPSYKTIQNELTKLPKKTS